VLFCNSLAFGFLLQASNHEKPLRDVKDISYFLMYLYYYTILRGL